MSKNNTVATSEGNDTLALGEEILLRLLLPTAAFVLAILYVDSVHGRIAFSDLWYPYLVIAVLVILTVSIYFEEILEINRIRKEENRPPFANSMAARVKEWQKSIGLAVFGFVYLWLINILGFFVSSALLMITVMIIAGEQDYRRIVIVIAVVLSGIWLFTRFLTLSPPTGVFV